MDMDSESDCRLTKRERERERVHRSNALKRWLLKLMMSAELMMMRAINRIDILGIRLAEIHSFSRGIRDSVKKLDFISFLSADDQWVANLVWNQDAMRMRKVAWQRINLQSTGRYWFGSSYPWTSGRLGVCSWFSWVAVWIAKRLPHWESYTPLFKDAIDCEYRFNLKMKCRKALKSF